MVRVVDNKNPDSIWVKIINGHKGKHDLFLGTYYVSPDNKNNKNFHIQEKKISMKFQKNLQKY